MKVGYCYATADAVRAYSPVLGICIPEAATTGQVLSVIVKFMTEHPEVRDKNIQLIVAEATIELGLALDSKTCSADALTQVTASRNRAFRAATRNVLG